MNYSNLEVTLDTVIEQEKILLEVNGSMLFASNTLSCIVGAPKSRKSFARDLLIGKMFNNDDKFKGEFTGRCLVIDTEQSTRWVKKSVERLHSMGVDVRDRLTMVPVKRFNTNERLKIIEHYIQEKRPEIVFIDGIRDLIVDFNDIGESTMVMNFLMRLVNDYNIHICSILHVNHGSDKARGHLGSEILNKCDAVLKVETRGGGSGATTALTSVVMRDKDLEGMRFKIIDNKPVLYNG